MPELHVKDIPEDEDLLNIGGETGGLRQGLLYGLGGLRFKGFVSLEETIGISYGF